LSDHITGPVLDHLGLTGTPRDADPWQRVWWCPSGQLALLPLHAAGHHRRSGPASAAVIDRVISSTVPNMGALLHARRVRRTELPAKVLAVTMPHTPGQCDLPGAAEEAATLKRLWPGQVSVLGLPETPAASTQAVAAQLPSHRWVHFACHGHSDPDDPSASHLQLADGSLTVADLTHTRLPAAELAFLSACTTGRTGARLSDEPIHLAAACQLAGYRHVVASLWPISDYYSTKLADSFYTILQTAGANPLSDASAVALHRAARELRVPNRAQPSIWAPYIHIGP
jgi:CHAT domain-containing protein